MKRCLFRGKVLKWKNDGRLKDIRDLLPQLATNIIERYFLPQKRSVLVFAIAS